MRKWEVVKCGGKGEEAYDEVFGRGGISGRGMKCMEEMKE